MSVSSQVNWACNFIVGLVFPYLVLYLGPYSFGPFACVLLAVFLYSLFILPETQGSSPEELAAELSRTLSKSVVYQHNEETADQIDIEWRKAMEQLQQEEEAERQAGVSLRLLRQQLITRVEFLNLFFLNQQSYDYGFQPIQKDESLNV